MTNDRITYYMSLRYPITLVPDPDEGFVAELPDLPGCFAQGESADETIKALETSRRLWIEARLERDLPIPEPTEVEDHSGRFVLRLQRSVHAELARRAARDGVSLNHYVSTALARHLGAAPVQEFTERMTRRLEDVLADLQIAAKRSSGQVTTAFMFDTSMINTYATGRLQTLFPEENSTKVAFPWNEAASWRVVSESPQGGMSGVIAKRIDLTTRRTVGERE